MAGVASIGCQISDQYQLLRLKRKSETPTSIPTILEALCALGFAHNRAGVCAQQSVVQTGRTPRASARGMEKLNKNMTREKNTLSLSLKASFSNPQTFSAARWTPPSSRNSIRRPHHKGTAGPLRGLVRAEDFLSRIGAAQPLKDVFEQVACPVPWVRCRSRPTACG